MEPLLSIPQSGSSRCISNLRQDFVDDVARGHGSHPPEHLPFPALHGRRTGPLEALLTIDRDAVSKILKIGVPAGLQGMVFSLANVCIQSGINSFGAGGIAGSAVELNYEYFLVV